MEKLQSDPTLKSADAAYEADLKSAQSVFMTAKRKIEEKRLSVYQERLKDFTKAGDFDRAVACKAAIENLDGIAVTIKDDRPKDAFRFDGHEYALIRERVTWHVAKRRCEMMGGHLAFAKTKKEFSAILRVIGHEIAWLGASDEEKEGEWKWIDGTKMTPFRSNFDNHKETQHHLMVVGRNGDMDDGNAGSREFFMCEWDS